jgi:hypothetical protein
MARAVPAQTVAGVLEDPAIAYTGSEIAGVVHVFPLSGLARRGVPPIRRWSALLTGKSVEVVVPAIYTLPEASVATARPKSDPLPPMVLE